MLSIAAKLTPGWDNGVTNDMSIKNLGIAAMACCAVIFSPPANAEINGGEMMKRIDEGSMPDKIALISYSTAYEWANTRLAYEKKNPLFCPPPKLSMTPDQTIDIFRQYVKSHVIATQTPAGLVMLWALEDTFPCYPKATSK